MAERDEHDARSEFQRGLDTLDLHAAGDVEGAIDQLLDLFRRDGIAGLPQHHSHLHAG